MRPARRLPAPFALASVPAPSAAVPGRGLRWAGIGFVPRADRLTPVPPGGATLVTFEAGPAEPCGGGALRPAGSGLPRPAAP